jgi:hypothetical protein
VLLAVLALLAASCGRGDDSDSDAADTTVAPDTGGDATTTTAADGTVDCDAETTEATEVGVTADSITIVVSADVGSPLAPGLFQGNFDALNAFAKHVNDNGGIACRELIVKTWDSKLDPTESKNGQIDSCGSALAMVGGNNLFNPDTTTLATCVDKAGNPTGLPDLAALAADVNQQCNTTTFLIQGVSEKCPSTGGVRPFLSLMGPQKWMIEQFGPLHGVYVVSGDLPTLLQTATYQVAGQAEGGITFDGTLKISGRDEQPAFTPKIQAIKSFGATYVHNGSNEVAMVKLRKEANAQGVDSVTVWSCTLACYSKQFLDQGGADVEGTYVAMQFLPFEERDSNEELAAYLDGVGEEKADSFGAQAWMAGVVFEQAIEKIVEADGVNGITRAAVLDTLAGMGEVDANGFMGTKDLRGFSNCFLMLQVQGGKFVRVYPEEPGTLDCSDDNITTVTLDPAVEAAKIQ